MFISSPFNPARHPSLRVSVCANECGNSCSGMLSVMSAGIDVSVYLDIADIERLAQACADTLRKLREQDQAELADPTPAEEVF